MRKRLRAAAVALEKRLHSYLTPPRDPVPELREQNAFLTEELVKLQREASTREARGRWLSMVGELTEARQMAGAGPWQASPRALQESDRIIRESLQLSESALEGAIGATGDINLMLANVEWRREINLSWLEFSRWGIQQIILISRLYYVKNPICRRLVDVCSAYVFARGVEVTTNNPKANDVLKSFFTRNARVFGQIALCEAEKRKDYDGNLFWALFSDKVDKGLVDARLIDATEIQDIVCDPEDSDTPWYYRRQWSQRNFDPANGVTVTTEDCWYPALGYDPPAKPDSIQGHKVMWESPVYHRKCGYVGKWLFGCPRIFPMLDWAREARHYLEAVASVAQSLMQIALVWKTKGGQSAIAGIKQQIGTTVGPSTPLWDTNPPAVPGASVVSGPGTTVEAFNAKAGGLDPDGVRQYKLMCCMVAGVPETFLADVSTGNLATATSLDRPTETVFLEKQEAWVEDLTVIAKYVLQVSAGAPSGKLREANIVSITECARKKGPRGEIIYEALQPSDDKIEIQVNFPAIREGDVPALVGATVNAMTLGNRAGQTIGIDEKTGVKKLYDLLGIEGGNELAEEQYPEGEYEVDRSKQEVPPPIARKKLLPGGEPQIGPDGEQNAPPAGEVQEALRRIHEATKIYAEHA